MRQKLSSTLTIEALFMFGSYRLFAFEGDAPTPTVESMILVATKSEASAGHRIRVVSLEDDAAAPRHRSALLGELAKRGKGKPGRRNGIHVHDVPQASLDPRYPWPVKHAAEDLASRVVAHLQNHLESGQFEPLSQSWKIVRGIETGADAYSLRLQRRLGADTKRKLADAGATTGEPILELPAGLEQEKPWSAHPELLARSPEARGILYAAVDDGDYTTLLRLTREEPPPDVLEKLDRWRPVLATRAENARNPKRRWWETLWPRDLADMRAPKVIALYRSDRGRFALDEGGVLQPSNKATIVVGKSADAQVAYLCGVLNSELLDLWYAVRGKTPWHVRRNYEPLRMNEMPYRPPADDPRVEEVEALVRQIASNRRALLPHRSVAPELTAVVKDPWQARSLELDVRAMIAELPGADTISVRVHPGLTVTGEPAGKARRIDRRTLAFRRGRGEAGRIVGDPRLIDLLERLVPAGGVEVASAILFPRDPNALEIIVDARRTTIDQLLAEGRVLVEQVERLVCALYDVPDDLAEEVVQHALQRAAAKTPSD